MSIEKRVVSCEKRGERRIERPTFNIQRSTSNRRNIEYRMQRREESVKSRKKEEYSPQPSLGHA